MGLFEFLLVLLTVANMMRRMVPIDIYMSMCTYSIFLRITMTDNSCGKPVDSAAKRWSRRNWILIVSTGGL